ncbi:hypothetical protein [Tengunoibacter tsumagoiensis]|uniref:Uncharacterized protein n=1 Tax=Tengunoibacter tsumagoiensis TaxID=2014871 RepID=A0A402A4X3_9CHLR|nr:hypothetical protein [Tengunoibacter tsumagoiensis]GCE14198.1 hypothetical protein KTT_40570 [Tengunoibacter tsumagoiensis]GCE14252.1 hypothetical protein KTT_41110 [Tengunoibacter tsumagoiensis]
MFDTTMTIKRSAATVRTGIPTNIQNMQWRVAADLGGQSPYDSFWIRSTGGGPLDIRRGDLLIDEHNIDPLTGALTRYRVFGNVESYGQTYAKIPAEKLLGV